MASPAPPRIATDSGQYVPGQILADRYRMVGLLGRGGMGEVYRADDLKLGQPVALKFLPRDVEHDSDRLQRFLDEVRLSLRVTHPNVCRVFDLGDVDGPSTGSGQRRHFLSMEYVDGEDLASLLRRIGRLPEDKATEIARQLCAGLAAAHDEGVLHRDLKPANVMIDGRGRAKITDFGLAGATAGISGREAQAGTPQYMAPEQFEGRELSVQTDIYSLGLVLYEVFTGKRAFDSRDLNELKALHSSAPTNPSVHVAGLNPIVERAILRCVDPDPGKRPRSAASLAAALPGGDPLEMAIAAGETPSPEMVAQSGGRGELRPAVAAACLAIVLVGLAATWMLYGSTSLPNRVPLPKPPEELRVAARAAITAAGYTPAPSGSVSGFWSDVDYLNKIEKENQSTDRWDHLGTVWPPAVALWYRESARGMAPFNNFKQITYENPPVDQPGMVAVRVDPSGRLLSFRAVPDTVAKTTGPWPEPDWAPLFTAAGLTIGEWQTSDPVRAPAQPSDLRRAWAMGTTRVEAASMRGRPVWFLVVPEWLSPADAPPADSSAAGFLRGLLQIAVVVAGAVFARRNLRLDRSDKRGAQRLATVFLLLGAAAELLQLSGTPASWFATFTNNLALEVYSAAMIWIFYLAIEPYVRRLWPETLVAWSRVLEGRFRDPMVGRHVLIGALAGMSITLLSAVPDLVRVFGLAPPRPILGNLDAAASFPLRLSQLFEIVQSSFFIPVSILLAVLLFRVIFRRPWLAYGALVLLITTVFGLAQGANRGLSADVLVIAGMTVMFGVLVLVVLTRFGLFAMLVTIIFSFWSELALTTNSSSWIFPGSVMTIATFVAIAIYGFWISLGNQKVFKDAI
ncbi:MAG TPA: protein kinase [Vicinamibacterales bacterium]|nr:protein kinase [Vicinamibacterales bacterium]